MNDKTSTPTSIKNLKIEDLDNIFHADNTYNYTKYFQRLGENEKAIILNNNEIKDDYLLRDIGVNFHVFFENLLFLGSLMFQKVNFLKSIKFTGGEYQKNLTFLKCNFTGIFEISGDNLFESVIFIDCTFHEDFTISEGTFQSELLFNNCSFYKNFEIKNGVFNSNVSIVNNSNFHNDLKITNGKFLGTFEININKIDGNFQIYGGHFENLFLVRGGTFNGTFNICGGIFNYDFKILFAKFNLNFIISSTPLFKLNFIIEDGEFSDGVRIFGGIFLDSFVVFNGIFSKIFYVCGGNFQSNITVHNGTFNDRFQIEGECRIKDFHINGGTYKNNFIISGGKFLNSIVVNAGIFEKQFLINHAYIYWLHIMNIESKIDLTINKDTDLNILTIHQIIPKESIINISTNLYALQFLNVINFGTIFIKSLTYKGQISYLPDQIAFTDETLPKYPEICIEDSDLGKTTFIGCDLTLYGLIFKDSKITETFVTGTRMPRRIVTKLHNSNKEDFRQQQLGYSQIKKIYESRGDKVAANNYYGREMECYYNTLSWDSNFTEKFNLSLNKYSTKYGQSWMRGLLSTLVVSLSFYTLYCYLLGFKVDWSSLNLIINVPTVLIIKYLPLDNSIETFTKIASYFLEFVNPIHKADYVAEELLGKNESVNSLARITEGISRIFIAYVVFQLIQAFRKHGKSSN